MKSYRDLKRQRSTEDSEKRGYEWRTLKFSDFECVVGNRTFELHRVIIGTGSRSAKFFSAITNEEHTFKELKERRMDLTELLPEKCWPYFETFLDFVYQQDIIFSKDNVVPLLKIANILDCQELGILGLKKLVEICKKDPAEAMSLTPEVGQTKSRQDIYRIAVELDVEKGIELSAPYVTAEFMETCLLVRPNAFAAASIASSCIQLLKTCKPQERHPWDTSLKGRVIETKGPVAIHTGVPPPNTIGQGMKTYQFFRWGSIYTKDVATSGVHYWRVRVSGSTRATSDDNSFGFAIGVARKSMFHKREHNDDFIGYLGYAYIARDGNKFSHKEASSATQRYGPKYEGFDTIGVELDLNRKTIEFYKNDEPLGVAYKDVTINSSEGYRLGCSMHNAGWSVELISHEVLAPEEEVPLEIKTPPSSRKETERASKRTRTTPSGSTTTSSGSKRR